MTPEQFEKEPGELSPEEQRENEGIEIEGSPEPLSNEEINEKVADLWAAHDKMTEKPLTRREKKYNIPRVTEIIDKCPDIPVFYTITAESLDSYPERLREFQVLWQKFISGEKIEDEDKGMFETFYRGFLKG